MHLFKGAMYQGMPAISINLHQMGTHFCRHLWSTNLGLFCNFSLWFPKLVVSRLVVPQKAIILNTLQPLYDPWRPMESHEGPWCKMCSSHRCPQPDSLINWLTDWLIDCLIDVSSILTLVAVLTSLALVTSKARLAITPELIRVSVDTSTTIFT